MRLCENNGCSTKTLHLFLSYHYEIIYPGPA